MNAAKIYAARNKSAHLWQLANYFLLNGKVKKILYISKMLQMNLTANNTEFKTKSATMNQTN